MNFKPISEAPVSLKPYQILCRFWYPYNDAHWVYFVAQASGALTWAPGYAKPEEWCELPQ